MRSICSSKQMCTRSVYVNNYLAKSKHTYSHSLFMQERNTKKHKSYVASTVMVNIKRCISCSKFAQMSKQHHHNLFETVQHTLV